MKLARVLGHAMAWHVTFAVNSLCHDAKEEDHGPPVGRSRDIGALCLLSCGDAYHAAHHARARRAPRAAGKDRPRAPRDESGGAARRDQPAARPRRVRVGGDSS